MTSVLATVSLSFSPLRSHDALCFFFSCSGFEKECYLRYHSFFLFLFDIYVCFVLVGSQFPFFGFFLTAFLFFHIHSLISGAAHTLTHPNDAANYPVEFLNDQTPSGMPPHVLMLKRGVIIMLLRNLNPKKGLCNGTRMIVRHLQRNFITAEIISECNRGDTVFIPRIDLAPSDTALPFILRRRQFPIIPAYAITINKSQGQTFDHVGIDLKTAVFSHGQLYVALSRSRNPQQVKVRIQPNPQQGQLLQDEHQFTRNVVFKEVFQL